MMHGCVNRMGALSKQRKLEMHDSYGIALMQNMQNNYLHSAQYLADLTKKLSLKWFQIRRQPDSSRRLALSRKAPPE